jgi:glycyl-tRNA synthetase (class II)
MQNVNEQKIKLEQKKNRLLAEETRLKLKERKMRTRHLIELGGLVTKANLDYLSSSTFYGALLSLAHSLETNPTIKDEWTKLGKAKFDQEKKEKTALILKFAQQPSDEIRKTIRNHGLKWNKFRSEWYGECFDIDSLKNDLASIQHTIEILK